MAVVLPFLAASAIILVIRPRTLLRAIAGASLGDFPFAAIFVAGVLASVLLFPFVRFNVSIEKLTDHYFLRALNIVQYGVFGTGAQPTAYMPPGYTFLLLPGAWILGRSPWAFVVTNLILVSGTALLLREFLLRAGRSRGLANALSLCVLLYPNRWCAVWAPMSDIPFSLLFGLAFACFLVYASGAARWRYLILAGVLAGASALVRTSGLFLSVPLIAGFGLIRAAPRMRALRVIVGLVTMALVLAPWLLRNYALVGRVVPITTNGGYNLLVGNNPLERGIFNTYADTLFAHEGNPEWGEARRDSFFTSRAIGYIEAHPAHALLSAARKNIRAFASDTFTMSLARYETSIGELPPVFWNALYAVNNLFYFTLMLSTLAILAVRWHMARPAGVVFAGIVVCVCVLIGCTFGMTRFKEPLNILSLLLLGYCAGGAGAGAGPQVSFRDNSSSRT